MHTKTFTAVILLLVMFKAAVLFVGLPISQSVLLLHYRADLFPDGYDLIAMNLVEGYGYRFYPQTSETMLRMPGFVLLLAGIFALFGKSLAAVKVVHLILSAVTALLVYLLGVRIAKGRRVAGLAAIVYFLHPATVLADSRGGVETLLTLTLTLFTLLLYRALDRSRLLEWALAGLAFGLLLLIKSSGGLVPAFLLIYLILRERRWELVGKVVARVIVFGLAATLMLTPWIIRNFKLTGKFVPTMTTMGGMAAFHGLNVVKHQDSGKPLFELYLGGMQEQKKILEALGLRYYNLFFPHFYTPKDELFFYNYLGQMAMNEYRQSPALLLKTIAHNFVAFWVLGMVTSATLLNTIITVPLLVLTAIGIFLAYRSSMPISPLLLIVAAFLAAHLPILGEARYHVPLIPLLVILASVPLIRWISRWESHRDSTHRPELPVSHHKRYAAHSGSEPSGSEPSKDPRSKLRGFQGRSLNKGVDHILM